jgi:hypothetical protein
VASSSNGAFRGALIGAALAFFVGMLTNFWSNYLTRRDQHVQEAEKCMGVVSSLLTAASMARGAAQVAVSSIAEPVSTNSATNKFVWPPLDEILHSQNQNQLLGLQTHSHGRAYLALRHTIVLSETSCQIPRTFTTRVKHLGYTLILTIKICIKKCLISSSREPTRQYGI